jgi:EmrB/QacA subfamily drug resistance transporter
LPRTPRLPEASDSLHGERGLVLTAALAAMLLPLNSTMIAVAIPDIAREFDADAEATAWLVSGYLIVMASLQPLAGKLGDRFGRRPLILGGLGWFAASLGAALAPSLAVLIAFRLQQAVAGALAFPNALAVVREALPAERRGAAFGMLGSAVALAAAAGPPLGGVLVSLGGWRAIFLVNLPWVGLTLLLALRTVPADLGGLRRGRFDAIGAVALTAILAGWAWLLDPGEVADWVVPAGFAALALALVVLLRFELAHPDPVLQPRLLRVKSFTAATAAMGLSNFALYGTLLAVPVFLSQRGGWSSSEIGTTLAALTLPMVALSPVGGRLADRLGRRVIATAGLVLLGSAMLALSVAGRGVSAPLLVGLLFCAGAGLGLSHPPIQTAGMEALEPRDAGVAAGLFSTGRYLGGIAAASVVAASLTDEAGDAYASLFALAAGAAWLAAILSTALPGRPRIVTTQDAARTHVS